MKLEDPTTVFEKNHAPGDLKEEYLKSTIKVKMWELHIKQYLSREWKIRGNIHRVYAIILGKFTQALRSTLKGDPEYVAKSEMFVILWLLLQLKKMTAGVNAKANQVLVLQEHIISFLYLHQGQNESEEKYLPTA